MKFQMKKIEIVAVFSLLISVLVFAGCTSSRVIDNAESTLSPVYVTNTKPVQLLPPQSMNGAESSLQLLNGDFGTQGFSLLVYFEADENGIFMTLLNDFGTDMGSLSYDGKSVSFQSAVFPKNMKAEYIVADIQNAYYKVEDLKANYKAAGLVFEVVEEDGKIIRRIKNGKKVVEEITISGNSIRIQNVLRGYEYKLTGEE